jgi:hypothetical protein
VYPGSTRGVPGWRRARRDRRWWEAGEADAWVVGDERAALERGRTRRTGGVIGGRAVAPF